MNKEHIEAMNYAWNRARIRELNQESKVKTLRNKLEREEQRLIMMRELTNAAREECYGQKRPGI